MVSAAWIWALAALLRSGAAAEAPDGFTAEKTVGCYLYGFRIVSAVDPIRDVENPQKCQEACQADSSCISFSYNKVEEYCSLGSAAMTERTADPDVISGPQWCSKVQPWCEDVPDDNFPGDTAEASDAAWPGQISPPSLQCWPRTGGENSLAECMEEPPQVLQDMGDGFGNCRNLTEFFPGLGQSCADSCRRNPRCSLWQTTGKDCWQGVLDTGKSCYKSWTESNNKPINGSMMLHGHYRKLKDLSGWWVNGLVKIDVQDDNDGASLSTAVQRCFLMCLSVLDCSVWMYSTSSAADEAGCWIDSSNPGTLEYPSTTATWSNTGSAESVVAGQYLQRQCGGMAVSSGRADTAAGYSVSLLAPAVSEVDGSATSAAASQETAAAAAAAGSEVSADSADSADSTSVGNPGDDCTCGNGNAGKFDEEGVCIRDGEDCNAAVSDEAQDEPCYCADGSQGQLGENFQCHKDGVNCDLIEQGAPASDTCFCLDGSIGEASGGLCLREGVDCSSTTATPTVAATTPAPTTEAPTTAPVATTIATTAAPSTTAAATTTTTTATTTTTTMTTTTPTPTPTTTTATTTTTTTMTTAASTSAGPPAPFWAVRASEDESGTTPAGGQAAQRGIHLPLVTTRPPSSAFQDAAILPTVSATPAAMATTAPVAAAGLPTVAPIAPAPALATTTSVSAAGGPAGFLLPLLHALNGGEGGQTTTKAAGFAVAGQDLGQSDLPAWARAYTEAPSVHAPAPAPAPQVEQPNSPPTFPPVAGGGQMGSNSLPVYQGDSSNSQLSVGASGSSNVGASGSSGGATFQPSDFTPSFVNTTEGIYWVTFQDDGRRLGTDITQLEKHLDKYDCDSCGDPCDSVYEEGTVYDLSQIRTGEEFNCDMLIVGAAGSSIPWWMLLLLALLLCCPLLLGAAYMLYLESKTKPRTTRGYQLSDHYDRYADVGTGYQSDGRSGYQQYPYGQQSPYGQSPYGQQQSPYNQQGYDPRNIDPRGYDPRNYPSQGSPYQTVPQGPGFSPGGQPMYMDLVNQGPGGPSHRVAPVMEVPPGTPGAYRVRG